MVHCPGSSGRSHWAKVVLGKILVEQMDAKAITNALEFGDHVADVLDALHLFIQVVGLEEVTQMGVSIVAGRDMQLEQALVHLQKELQGIHRNRYSLQTGKSDCSSDDYSRYFPKFIK